jgi:hypothetical protein
MFDPGGQLGSKHYHCLPNEIYAAASSFANSEIVTGYNSPVVTGHSKFTYRIISFLIQLIF